jgi:hypothetical protein
MAERGDSNPETLSSLHAFQACALNGHLSARNAIMHHTAARSHLRDRGDLAPHTQCRDRLPAIALLNDPPQPSSPGP